MIPKAIAAGRQAYADGLPSSANPYRDGSSMSFHWHIAWALARLVPKKVQIVA